MGRPRNLFSRLYRWYGLYWNLKSLNEAKAMASIAQTTDPGKFWQGGKEIAAALIRHTRKDSVVLDFGSGIGRVARFIAPHCREIWCVDASSRMLKLASEALQGLGNVHFLRTSGIRIRLPDEKFDFAYSILTLQHMEKEDAYGTLREIQSP